MNNGHFYPNDVESKVSKSGNVKESEKAQVFLFSWGVLNFMALFAVPQFLKGLGIPLLVSILLILLANVLLGSVIFRFFVIKEQERVREYDSYETDSFAKYFKVSKEASHEIDVRGHGPVEVLEYENGTHMVALRLRYGSNDDEKVIKTKEVFTKIYRLLGKADLEFKTVTFNENFRESAELERYVKKVNKSDYKDLNLRILNNMLEYSERSNVIVTTILIKTRKKHQRYDLNLTLANIMSIIPGETKCAFRSKNFLTHREYVEFAREYYGLELIDLSMVKSMEPNLNELKSYLGDVQVYGATMSDGTYYPSKDSIRNKGIKTLSKEVTVHESNDSSRS